MEARAAVQSIASEAQARERRRQAVIGEREKYRLSERQACRIVGQPRGTQRYMVIAHADEDA